MVEVFRPGRNLLVLCGWKYSLSLAVVVEVRARQSVQVILEGAVAVVAADK
jgi:hypothetical protein